jgi:hypothetical protein
MRKIKKRSLRNAWRRQHKRAPRREIGRTPNWVIQERRERRRLDEESE